MSSQIPSSQTATSQTESSQTRSAQTSRINGAKSHGPVTAEGKARSSRNAIKHGLNSELVVLDHEDREAFEQLRESYMDDFHAANQSQADLVETMVAARWRMNRAFMIEGQLLEKEMAVRRKEVEHRFPAIDAGERLGCAFETLSEGKSLSLYLRYEAQINRTYDRALKQLLLLQSAKPAESTETMDTPPPADNPPADPIAAQPEPPNEPEPLPIPLPNEPSEAPADFPTPASSPDLPPESTPAPPTED